MLTRVDSLRKMYVPRLRVVDFGNNFINSWDKFFEMHSHNLVTINLQKNRIANINHMVKNVEMSGLTSVHILDCPIVRIKDKLAQRKKTRAKSYCLQDGKIMFR